MAVNNDRSAAEELLVTGAENPVQARLSRTAFEQVDDNIYLFNLDKVLDKASDLGLEIIVP